MSKKNIPELKIETIAERTNVIYLSLLEYKRDVYLCVIDDITSSEIGAFVLDYAEQENININRFLSVVTHWFYSASDKHSLSIELSKQGLTESLTPIYRTFDTSYVTRIVGHAFSYPNSHNTKTKRRRVIPIPEGVTIRFKKPQ